MCVCVGMFVQAMFDQECTQLTDYLFVAGLQVANSYDLLQLAGITHIINAAGDLSQNLWEDKGLVYLRFCMLDSPHQCIMSEVYQTLDFVSTVQKQSGKVLIHCQKGVSRSVALCIAHLMYVNSISYEQAFAYVKARRSVCRPNVGFMCQLIEWHNRRQGGLLEKYNAAVLSMKQGGDEASADMLHRHAAVMYRVCAARELHGVLTLDGVLAEDRRSHLKCLDSSSLYLLFSLSHQRVFVWVGRRCQLLAQYLTFARFLIERMAAVERLPQREVLLLDGAHSVAAYATRLLVCTNNSSKKEKYDELAAQWGQFWSLFDDPPAQLLALGGEEEDVHVPPPVVDCGDLLLSNDEGEEGEEGESSFAESSMSSLDESGISELESTYSTSNDNSTSICDDDQTTNLFAGVDELKLELPKLHLPLLPTLL